MKTNCLICDKEVEQREGYRARLYCSDACRQEGHRRRWKGKSRKVIVIPVEKYKVLLEGKRETRPMPQRGDFATMVEFSNALSEWKKKYG